MEKVITKFNDERQPKQPIEGDTLTVTPYRGQVIEEKFFGEDYRYIFDLDTLKVLTPGIPGYMDHDPSRIIGEYTQATLDDDYSLNLTGNVFQNPEVETLRQFTIPIYCSFALETEYDDIEEYREGETVTINGSTHEGPLQVFRNSTVYECSLTHRPRLDSTQVSLYSLQENKFMVGKKPDGARGTENIRSVIKQYTDICADKEKCFAAIDKNQSVEDFQAEYFSDLKTENAQLRKELDKLKIDYKAGQAEIDELTERVEQLVELRDRLQEEQNDGESNSDDDDDDSSSDGDGGTRTQNEDGSFSRGVKKKNNGTSSLSLSLSKGTTWKHLTESIKKEYSCSASEANKIIRENAEYFSNYLDEQGNKLLNHILKG